MARCRPTNEVASRRVTPRPSTGDRSRSTLVTWCSSIRTPRTTAARTNRPRARRAFYLTYNAAADGDFRATYYADKESEFEREGETFGEERVRISASPTTSSGRPVESMSDVIDELVELYCRAGGQSALRRSHHRAGPCASKPRRTPPRPATRDELIAASLLHDVGHLLIHDNRTLDEELTHNHGHDRAGAAPSCVGISLLRSPTRFGSTSKRSGICVRSNRATSTSLSPSSVRSLELQGGPMSNGRAGGLRGRAALRGRGHAAALRRGGEGRRARGASLRALCADAARVVARREPRCRIGWPRSGRGLRRRRPRCSGSSIICSPTRSATSRLTASEVAAEVGTSESTVIRAAQRLGFVGYTESADGTGWRPAPPSLVEYDEIGLGDPPE